MSVPEHLSKLSPSQKLTYFALKRDGPLSWTDLRNRTRLPPSTLADALDTLAERGIVERDEFAPLKNATYKLAESPTHN